MPPSPETSCVYGAILDVDGGQFHGLGYLGQARHAVIPLVH